MLHADISIKSLAAQGAEICQFFSCNETTIQACIRPLVGPSVTLLLFGLLGTTYAVYTALLKDN